MSVKNLTLQRLRQIVMEEAAAVRSPKKTIKLTESRLRQIIREELNENSPGESLYLFKVDNSGVKDIKNLAGDDVYEAVMRQFCINRGCEHYEVAMALQLALGQDLKEVAKQHKVTPEDAVNTAGQVLADLKQAYPGSVVVDVGERDSVFTNKQIPISDLSIS